MCEAIVIMLGSNDVCEYPGAVQEIARKLIGACIALHTDKVTKRVIFVEVGQRFGPNGFNASNTDFQPVPGVLDWPAVEDLYLQKITQFNDVMHQELKTHPDCYVVPLSGLNKDMRRWMDGDGRHLSPEDLVKAFKVIKRAAIKITKKDCFQHLTQGTCATKGACNTTK